MNAEITPATIEIKTLTIDGKRMSAALYRQLHHRYPIDKQTGEWRGTPLGSVNIHTKDCDSKYAYGETDHRHVVWHHNGTLHTGAVGLINPHTDPYDSDEADAWGQARYCANGHKMPDEFNYYGNSYWYTFPDSSIRVRMQPTYHGGPCQHGSADVVRLAGDLSAALRHEHQRRTRLAARIREAGQLPQLFIG